MKTYLNAILFSGAVLTAGSANAYILIDDFTTGAMTGSVTSGTTYFNGVGTMLGGDRLAELVVQPPNVFNLSFEIDSNAGVLAINSQSGVDGIATIGYGYNYINSTSFSTDDLNLNLTGENAFNLQLLSRDGDLTITFGVITTSGPNVSVSQTLLGSSINTPELVTFNFSSFVGANFADVDQIYVSFDTSNTGDVAVSSIEAVPEPATMAILAGAAALAASRKRKK